MSARLLEGESEATEPTGGRPPAERELPRVLLIPGILLSLVAVTLWISWVVMDQPHLWSMLDLQIYQDGGREAAYGHDLYSDGYSWVHLPFTYPPFAALIFSATSFLAFNTLQILMTALGVVSLLVVSWLSWGKLGYRASAGRVGATVLAAAFALCTEPVQQTFAFGQVNLILMLVVFGDLCLPDRWRIKGVGIGLAVGFKLVPGRFRAGFTALGAFAVSILGCFLIIPHESRQYWGGLFFDSSRVGTVSYVGNQSMHGWLFRMMDGGSLVQPAWLLAALIVCVGGLLLAAWQYRSGNELLSILIAATTGLLASPISWSHHWVWITMALILAAEWAWRTRQFVRLLIPAALLLLFAAWPQRQPDGRTIPAGLVWLVPNKNNLEYAWHGVQLIQGDVYTYIALAFFICLAVACVRRAGATAPMAEIAAGSTE